MALEKHRYKGIARQGKIELESGADIPEGAEVIVLLGADVEPVKSTPGVMGGDACIRNTRIPVWTLVDYKRQGLTDLELLDAFPILNPADLTAAWEYYTVHREEVDEQWKRHQDAA